MNDHGNESIHIDVGGEAVREINLSITAHSDRFLIGRDKELVKSLSSRAGLAIRKIQIS